MRLADYVVSYSLQINNRCLRYLAECDAHGVVADSNDIVGSEAHTVYAENLLARDSRRLVSMWSLMQPGWKQLDGEIEGHVAGLEEATRALTEASSTRRLALRLANLAAEDDAAQAILRVARCLPAEVPLTWDVLNEKFTRDSHFWRTSAGFRSLEDAAVQQRIVRSYRKGYRQAQLIPEDNVGAWLGKHGDNLYRWVQLSAHQLELLRPGLSDKGKAQLWYLDKMADTLRTRAGLQELQLATWEVDVKKAAAKVVRRYVEQQISKMDKRILRLVDGCFTSKPKRMDGVTQTAVSSLGLGSISLMTAAPAGGGANATENSFG
jgi:hypothetical protein